MDYKKILTILFLFLSAFSVEYNFSVEDIYPTWATLDNGLYHISMGYANGNYRTYFSKVYQIYPTFSHSDLVNLTGAYFPMFSVHNDLFVVDYFNSKIGKINFDSFPSLSFQYTSDNVYAGFPYKILDLGDGNHLVHLVSSSGHLLLLNSTGNVLSDIYTPGEYMDFVRYNNKIFTIESNSTGMYITVYNYDGNSMVFDHQYMVNASLFPNSAGGYNDDYKYLSATSVGHNDWIILLNQNSNRDATLLFTFNLTSGTVIDTYETNISYAYSHSARSIVYNQFDGNLYALMVVNTRLVLMKLNETGHFVSVKTGSLYPATDPYVPVVENDLSSPYGIIAEPIFLNESAIYWVLQLPVADKDFQNRAFEIGSMFGFDYKEYMMTYKYDYFFVAFNGTDIRYTKIGSSNFFAAPSFPVTATLSVYTPFKVVLLPLTGLNESGNVRKTAILQIDSLIGSNHSTYDKQMNFDTERTFNISVGQIIGGSTPIEPERLVQGVSGDIFVDFGSCDNVSVRAGPILTDKVTYKKFYWLLSRTYVNVASGVLESSGVPVESTRWTDTYHNENRTGYQVNYTGPAADYFFYVVACGSSDCTATTLQSGTQKCVAEPKVSSPLTQSVNESENVTIDAGIGEVGFSGYLTSFIAGLFVDGNFVKNITATDHVVSLNLSEGNHTIELSAYSLPDLYEKYQSQVFNLVVNILGNVTPNATLPYIIRGISGGGGGGGGGIPPIAKIIVRTIPHYRMKILRGVSEVYSGEVKPVQIPAGKYTIVVYNEKGEKVYEKTEYVIGNLTIPLNYTMPPLKPTPVVYQVPKMPLPLLIAVPTIIFILALYIIK